MSARNVPAWASLGLLAVIVASAALERWGGTPEKRRRKKKENNPWAKRRGRASAALASDASELEAQGADSLSTKQLLKVVGRRRAQAAPLERHELVELAESALAARASLVRVLESPGLATELLANLAKEDRVRFSGVSRACLQLCSGDDFWAGDADYVLHRRFLPRLSAGDARELVCAVKRARDEGFFTRLPFPSKSWKHFLASCLCCEATRAGGYGDAVVVPRAELCPHHILKLAHMVSVRKHPSCAMDILRRFLKMYSGMGGSVNLRDNVGYVFPVRSAAHGAESVSHRDFKEIARTSNLQIADLVAFQPYLLFAAAASASSGTAESGRASDNINNNNNNT